MYNAVFYQICKQKFNYCSSSALMAFLVILYSMCEMLKVSLLNANVVWCPKREANWLTKFIQKPKIKNYDDLNSWIVYILSFVWVNAQFCLHLINDYYTVIERKIELHRSAKYIYEINNSHWLSIENICEISRRMNLITNICYFLLWL